MRWSYAGSSIGRSRRDSAVRTSERGHPTRAGFGLAFPSTTSISFSALNAVPSAPWRFAIGSLAFRRCPVTTRTSSCSSSTRGLLVWRTCLLNAENHAKLLLGAREYHVHG